MNRLFSAILSLTSTFTALALISGGVALIAGEVRLAALKKASKGSTKLTPFTEKMTGMKLNL
jgi:uncharacterized membrane protein YidH (DUF202 family)